MHAHKRICAEPVRHGRALGVADVHVVRRACERNRVPARLQFRLQQQRDLQRQLILLQPAHHAMRACGHLDLLLRRAGADGLGIIVSLGLMTGVDHHQPLSDRRVRHFQMQFKHIFILRRCFRLRSGRGG